MANRSPLFIAAIYMVAYTISFSALWACIRHLSSDIHPLVLVFFRTFFGMLFILPVLLKTRLPALSSGRYPLFILRGILNITSVMGAFYAVSLIPLADAVAYSYLAPIFATVLAVFILKETIGRHRILAILISFLGVLILVRPGFQTLSIGILSALGAAVCFAATLICVKLLTRHESPSIVSLMSFFVAIPISLVAALFYWQWPSGEQWFYIVFMGILSAVAHICLAKALSKADLSAIMPLDFTRIIFAAIMGVTLFGDSLNGLTFLGGSIILASAVYATHREKKQQMRTS
ncbi:MAG: DMT family transporter [Emcibacter sp.]|nr:DMT family transporter [Emcibacter sp.]MBL4894522.1 DMT family transporter [Emcibacter sp.]